MGREAAENSQEHTDISEQQAPTTPSHHSPENAQTSKKGSCQHVQQSSSHSRRLYMYPSPWQHYSSCLCNISSLCSLQHCRSFPAHLLRHPGHCRGGSCTRGSRPPQKGQVSARGNVTSPQSPRAQKQHLQSPCERQWLELGRQVQEQAKSRECFGCLHLLQKCTGCL